MTFSADMTIEDIALQMTPGIGVKGAIHLLEVFGDAQHIFAASPEQLIGEAQLRPDLARQISNKSGFADAEKELLHCRRNNITAIASTDPQYPALLREIPDYPPILYIKGDPRALDAHCLSVVGTREMTPYGLQMCNRLIEGLSGRISDLTIVSGLAFGIDAAAHRAALANGLRTVAVLPNSLPQILPTQHTDLAREVLEHGGALISELHSQTRQNGTAYISRNRIVAGLSTGCLVVESPANGGSLITAQQADGYDRTVMAVPGRASDRTSFGTNHLIRTHKAQLILSAEDILRELMWDFDTTPAPNQHPQTSTLTPDEQGLLCCFRTSDPLPIEVLSELSKLDPGTLAALLVGLELAGVVRQLPGNRYMKLCD